VYPCNTPDFSSQGDKTLDKIHARVYNKDVERPHGDAGKQNPWGR